MFFANQQVEQLYLGQGNHGERGTALTGWTVPKVSLSKSVKGICSQPNKGARRSTMSSLGPALPRSSILTPGMLMGGFGQGCPWSTGRGKVQLPPKAVRAQAVQSQSSLPLE